MVPLMLTAVGVALPSIGKEFKASAGQLGLVEQLYTLSLAMSMLTFGRLGDVAGRVRVFFIGLVLFTVMTTSLGFVQSIGMLLIQRFFQ
jgi:MFS family permease